ncbi:efflux RND transporter permease subunit [Candidatus Kaiserbacteria bacterium]|nr:efflux RND transporter permease subunit [Candidatus Kaiserbacteria bacterium]
MEQNHAINIVGRISHFFTVNRSLSILLLITVLLFGLFAFWLTPKQYNPEIVRPAFAMMMHYQGASVDEASNRVVYELVEKIRTVPGVDDVYTEVTDGAAITTTVIFDVGYDATKAKLDLLSQINQHKYVRPGLISDPQIIEINPETIPVLQIVFGADDLSVAEVRSRVVELSHQLGSVPGVSEVSVHGGYISSLVVAIDPQKLAAAGVSVTELEQVLASSQVAATVTGLSDAGYQVATQFNGRVETAAEVGLLLITDTVRVRDVANVYEGAADTRPYVYYSNTDATGEVVVLAVSKVEGSSAPVVTKAALMAIDDTLSLPQYAGLTYQVVSNDGATAANEIFGLTKNLITSIAIVAVVLMLFLSLRAASVVLVAIPVTLLFVFGLGFLFDQTINRITLFALILSLGLLVDSAIVVVENIYSHLKEWHFNELDVRTREGVIARAVHEIGIGLLLSTVTSIIVFLPMGYITGMMGPYMGPIAFFVPAALLVSLLVAIVVTPFVAAHLITVDEQKGRLGSWFAKKMDEVTDGYTRLLGRILKSRRTQRWLLRSALGLFIITLILPLSGLVHFQMLPKADRDQFYVYIDLPREVSVDTTTDFSAAVSRMLLANGNVVNVQQYIGQAPVVDFNGMFKGAQNRGASYQSTVRVNLVPSGDRAESSTDIVNELRASLSEKFGDSAAYIRFMEEPPGPPVRATFVAEVTAADPATQADATTALFAEFATIDGVVDIYTPEAAPVSQVVYRFDREAAAALGVSIDSAQSALALLGGSIPVTEYLNRDGVEFAPVLLTLDPSVGGSTDISGLYVSAASGELVPLSAVLTTSTEFSPARADFDGTTPVTYITAEVEGRSIVYVMIDTMRSLIRGDVSGYQVESWGLFGMTLTQADTNNAVNIVWGGEWKMTLENFRDLGVAMGVALLLVYGVLVAQYNRFSTPAYILVTVPLGLVGILWGFFVLDTFFGIYLTATALIGFIALIGIVVNNAIIFLEYVEQMEQQGHPLSVALLESGKARLRPILLTSLTTILGSLTIAGDPVWSGLAWAIVFGLSLSTVLTLIIYPTLLMYFTTRDSV